MRPLRAKHGGGQGGRGRRLPLHAGKHQQKNVPEIFEKTEGRCFNPFAQIISFLQCCGTVAISYGSSSGSDFWQVKVPVPYLDHKKHSFKKTFGKNLAFLHSELFCKMWMKKILIKEIKYTIFYFVFVRTFVIPFYYGAGTVINSVSGSYFLTSYSSGSTRQKVTVPTVPVPVPQHCFFDGNYFTVWYKKNFGIFTFCLRNSQN